MKQIKTNLQDLYHLYSKSENGITPLARFVTSPNYRFIFLNLMKPLLRRGGMRNSVVLRPS